MKGPGILLTLDPNTKLFRRVYETISKPQCTHSYPVNSKYCNVCGKFIEPQTKNISHIVSTTDIIKRNGNLPYSGNDEMFIDGVFYIEYSFNHSDYKNPKLYQSYYNNNIFFIPIHLVTYDNYDIETSYIQMWKDIRDLRYFLIDNFKTHGLDIQVESGFHEITTSLEHSRL